jgi:mRNA-degrading endonuclease RelE of RelBE toxin-antitoxin system
MKRIQKFPEKLTTKERVTIDRIIERIIALDLDGLDLKKLKGYADIYRIRKGDVRVIFSIQGKKVAILEIGRKNDTTYNL